MDKAKQLRCLLFVISTSIVSHAKPDRETKDSQYDKYNTNNPMSK